MSYSVSRTKGGASIRATGKDAQKLFDMMTSKAPPFDKMVKPEPVARGISTSPVSAADALRYADELDEALVEVMNGKRTLGKLPMEPMARLIQFARDSAAAGATIPG